jgi:serine/threonine protein kinase
MLQIRPCDRMTAKELLQHEFLTHYDLPPTLPRSSLACPLSTNFLDQFKIKKLAKMEITKEDDEFNFMLESRESPTSPKARHSSVSQSMSASKIMEISRMEHLPYVFSQKKV